MYLNNFEDLVQHLFKLQSNLHFNILLKQFHPTYTNLSSYLPINRETFLSCIPIINPNKNKILQTNKYFEQTILLRALDKFHLFCCGYKVDPFQLQENGKFFFSKKNIFSIQYKRLLVFGDKKRSEMFSTVCFSVKYIIFCRNLVQDSL